MNYLGNNDLLKQKKKLDKNHNPNFMHTCRYAHLFSVYLSGSLLASFLFWLPACRPACLPDCPPPSLPTSLLALLLAFLNACLLAYKHFCLQALLPAFNGKTFTPTSVMQKCANVGKLVVSHHLYASWISGGGGGK